MSNITLVVCASAGLSPSEGKISFELSNSDPGFANALRRIILSEIPWYAIEMVEFEPVNGEGLDPLLPDEIVAHKLGCVPLQLPDMTKEASLDRELAAYPDMIYFSLNIAPRAHDSIINTNDIVCHSASGLRPRPNLPLFELKAGRSLKLTCSIAKNVGREHVKWSPVSQVTYRYDPSQNKWFFEAIGVQGMPIEVVPRKALEVMRELILENIM